MSLSSRLVPLLLGLLSGFVLGLIVSTLFLTWPIRIIGLALVAALSVLVIIWRGGKPLQRWHRIASGFILGYALSSALLAVLDLIFPPMP